jgi:hypothetical protein
MPAFLRTTAFAMMRAFKILAFEMLAFEVVALEMPAIPVARS